MAKFDVRKSTDEVITEIVFAEEESKDNNVQACVIKPNSSITERCILIEDGLDCVVVNSKEHALNLIKALNKAIELGWLK